MTPKQTAAFRLEDPDQIRRLNDLYAEVQRFLRPEDTVSERYAEAASAVEPALCCPVTYDAKSLGHIPERILAIDYGCGDPTVFAAPGMRVLDLGSGSGKHVFMIAKAVGPMGEVIGVDKTAAMLELSRGAVQDVQRNLGYEAPNTSFRFGHIDNLWIDGDRLKAWLARNSITSYDDLIALEAELDEAPLVASDSIDLVVSNCVLNLVEDGRKARLLRELYRVVKNGGSIAISDIVADRPIPATMKADPTLWSGCLSGAWQRADFLGEIAAAGFHGAMEIASTFWKRIDDINFFSVTVRAFKGKQGPCYETYRSAMYRGPFSEVRDDDDHVFPRGVFLPVCEKTAELLSREPYAAHFVVTPALVDPAEKRPFDCSSPAQSPRQLSAAEESRLQSLIDQGQCCEGKSCC